MYQGLFQCRVAGSPSEHSPEQHTHIRYMDPGAASSYDAMRRLFRVQWGWNRGRGNQPRRLVVVRNAEMHPCLHHRKDFFTRNKALYIITQIERYMFVCVHTKTSRFIYIALSHFVPLEHAYFDRSMHIKYQPQPRPWKQDLQTSI